MPKITPFGIPSPLSAPKLCSWLRPSRGNHPTPLTSVTDFVGGGRAEVFRDRSAPCSVLLVGTHLRAAGEGLAEPSLPLQFGSGTTKGFGVVRLRRDPVGVEEGSWMQNGRGRRPTHWVRRRLVGGSPPPLPAVPTHCPQPGKISAGGALLNKLPRRDVASGFICWSIRPSAAASRALKPLPSARGGRPPRNFPYLCPFGRHPTTLRAPVV